jgi:hypothetical protein
MDALVHVVIPVFASTCLSDNIPREDSPRDSNLAAGPAAHGDSRFVDRVGAAGDERMPPGQASALGDPSVRTGRWEPRISPHLGRVELDAVRHGDVPALVVAAPARSRIEQATGNFGNEDRASLLFLHLEQTALAASVTKRLPLGRRHGFERLGFPKGSRGCAVSRRNHVHFDWQHRLPATWRHNVLEGIEGLP